MAGNIPAYERWTCDPMIRPEDATILAIGWPGEPARLMAGSTLGSFLIWRSDSSDDFLSPTDARATHPVCGQELVVYRHAARCQEGASHVDQHSPGLRRRGRPRSGRPQPAPLMS